LQKDHNLADLFLFNPGPYNHHLPLDPNPFHLDRMPDAVFDSIECIPIDLDPGD
jgi:hypothetical protein